MYIVKRFRNVYLKKKELIFLRDLKNDTGFCVQ